MKFLVEIELSEEEIRNYIGVASVGSDEVNPAWLLDLGVRSHLVTPRPDWELMASDEEIATVKYMVEKLCAGSIVVEDG